MSVPLPGGRGWGAGALQRAVERSRRSRHLGTEGLPSWVLARPEPALDVSLNMGCSLCSLQKPQEQYRLLYEVCQVTLALYPVQWMGAHRAAGNSWGRRWRFLCMFVFCKTA